MPERAGLSLQTEEATDLETALRLAHDHARMYGLWEVAEDLDRIIRSMQGREAHTPMPAIYRGRPRLRRRP
jgi:hypothetical protein